MFNEQLKLFIAAKNWIYMFFDAFDFTNGVGNLLHQPFGGRWRHRYLPGEPRTIEVDHHLYRRRTYIQVGPVGTPPEAPCRSLVAATGRKCSNRPELREVLFAVKDYLQTNQ